jgi:LacI family transcriptional regulator
MLKPREQVSQKQIAAAAGVSQATVSLVLSGSNVTSAETRARVLRAAEKLRYRPNLLVHGIQTGKTRTIGVMAPPYDFYWSEVLYGIHDVLSANDHVMITVWPAHHGPGPRRRHGPGMDELQQIHRLVDRRVDGVILWPPFASLFQQHVQEFVSRNLPVVTIDHELPPEDRADYVGNDEQAGGKMVAEHLHALGHRRFAHFAGASVFNWATARRSAFEDALRGLPGTSCFTIEGPIGDSSPAIVPAGQILDHPSRPTAIFAATDPFARALYAAAAERNLVIGKDVSIVGFSDHDFAAILTPPLTTVRQNGYAIGRAAAEIVLGRSTGSITEIEPQIVRMPVELVVRQSTGPVRND